MEANPLDALTQPPGDAMTRFLDWFRRRPVPTWAKVQRALKAQRGLG